MSGRVQHRKTKEPRESKQLSWGSDLAPSSSLAWPLPTCRKRHFRTVYVEELCRLFIITGNTGKLSVCSLPVEPG